MKQRLNWIWVMLLCIQSSMVSQKSMHDLTWIFGYREVDPNPMIGGTLVKFGREKLHIDTFDLITFPAQRTILSDSIGKLLFYSSGCNIIDSNHLPLEGGDKINSGRFHDNFCPRYPLSEGIAAIPSMYSPLTSYLFHLRRIGNFAIPQELLLSKIDYSVNDNGKVEFVDSLLLDHPMTDNLAMTKHGNGLDWWIIIPELTSNRYMKVLWDEIQISVDTQSIGAVWSDRDWSGQSSFSPNGTKYVRCNPYNGIDLFDFDRCSGVLSNPVHINFAQDDSNVSSGVSFSPSNRFMYVSTTLSVIQYDLHADNIPESAKIVAIYDGYISLFETLFYQHKLGPDGKIYICSPTGTNVLHVIHEPDSIGLKCDLKQHDITLPTYNAFEIPNMPNYRLGPLDGSPCDTLNRNNIPQAYFHYDPDTTDPTTIRFKNLSYFEPETYIWDFDDNSTSQEANPTHEFAKAGNYNVCLTASNQFGSTTDCYEIEIDQTTSVAYQGDEPSGLRIFPNPTYDIINIQISRGGRQSQIRILDVHGTVVITRKVTGSQVSIQTSGLIPGTYLIVVESMENGKVIGFDRFVQM